MTLLSTRLIVLSCILVGSTPLAAEPTARPKPCKEHPDLVGACFTIHGRLQFWNGNPSFRIRRIGTNRILGVSDQRSYREGYENLPPALEALAQEGPVVADFEVCPFTKEEPGVMQLVCVQGAKEVQPPAAEKESRIEKR